MNNENEKFSEYEDKEYHDDSYNNLKILVVAHK